MNGQSQIMEYVLLTFFIVVVIMAIIIFLSGWTIVDIEGDMRNSLGDRALGLMTEFKSSEIFVNDDSIFDYAKMTTLVEEGSCKRLEGLYGYSWYMELEALDGNPVKDCDASTYPDCNHWSLCKAEGKHVSYTLPVNVYKNVDPGTFLYSGFLGKTYVGILKVGVYYEA